MKMPKAGGFEYLVQARCALTSYPEWRMLHKENTRMLCAFIFEELLCRWGPITEIVTDNAPTYKVAVDELARKYGIHLIHISPYNSQANGIVERRHRNVQEAIIKTCEGDEMRWNQVVHSVFWVECVVRNHNSVGVKRPYLHELSFYHLHYGVARHFPV
jgi:transposase InsO family protein